YYADGSAAREVQWVYEPGSFRPLAQVEAQGDSTQLHYIVTDLTGTARELCSEEGEIRWRGEQGLWGAHREERRPIPLRRYLGDAANEEVYCELRYQGQLYDAETGLYYNRHRYYDAESGQYLSPDPIGLLGGIRPQAYVHNPLIWVDPLGLTEKEGVTTFYHAGNIQGPIDPSKGRANLDFNPAGQGGFYVTTDKVQAEEWSKLRDHPTIAQFDIPNSELTKLDIKDFSSANGEWADFVTQGRAGTLSHSHDAVSGPMLGNPGAVKRGKVPTSKGSQFAIFSDEAARLFDRFKL
ncbi:RHS repeat-associated core domain-containing protein, partial [Pectobacterium carotovorum]